MFFRETDFKADEINLLSHWKKQCNPFTPHLLDPIEKQVIEEILQKTNAQNVNNCTRTQAYLDFYTKHPEIHWALLAHLVSRNGGWSMTDLKGELLEHIFNERQKVDFFLFLEKANAFIFHDAYPQLLLYERSKKDRKNYFHLLSSFGVSIFMKPVWDSFFYQPTFSRLLTTALIINEQHYIESRLISNPYFENCVYESKAFRLQEKLHLNYVIFPREIKALTKLIGLNVSHFAPIEKRIELGKKLYRMLFSSLKARKEITDFVHNNPHTGSRTDYWPSIFSSTRPSSKIYSPTLEVAWNCYHHTFTNKDWFQTDEGFKYFTSVQLPKKIDITTHYAFTLKILHLHASCLEDLVVFALAPMVKEENTSNAVKKTSTDFIILFIYCSNPLYLVLCAINLPYTS